MHRLMVTERDLSPVVARQPAGTGRRPREHAALAARPATARRRGDPRRPARRLGPAEPRAGRALRLPRAPRRADQAEQQGGGLAGLGPARDRNRRSLYVFVRRNLRYPFFEAFDRPDTNASCPRRAVTTIAPAGPDPAEQPARQRRRPSLGRPRRARGGSGPATRRSIAPTGWSSPATPDAEERAPGPRLPRRADGPALPVSAWRC